jgi:ribose 5-phosphate isomerase B
VYLFRKIPYLQIFKSTNFQIKEMNNGLKIAIGADHAGFEYKQQIAESLDLKELKDFGTYSSASVDYPDFAHPVASAVESGEFDFGILICGSANGVAITANKHQGVRAAICWNEELASLARSHNNANIVCIPARFISIDEAKKIVKIFLSTEFEGGRHANRVNKIAC